MFMIQLTETTSSLILKPRDIWINAQAIAYFGVHEGRTFICFNTTENQITVAETPQQILERIPSTYH